ncbi:ATP-grasp domain-containing protein [Streptomyces xylophagus]|uniref:ATP-grasp domain-containing protein n=1 Tax=Streptomyces xylophagus TaxID=285514 RepID=UPI00068E1637|nr:ATP-grasp domain-containing protein [Streptomyces xylophagus]
MTAESDTARPEPGSRVPEETTRRGPAVLLGSKPAEGYETLARLGVPFIWVVDPVDEPPTTVPGAVRVVSAPFKSDPLSVLRLPLPPDVCGVLSFTEMGSLPAALLAEALGLPTVPVRAVLRARNKLLMRRTLAAVFDGPAFGVVGLDEPAADDFPLIAKPAEGTGSQGVEFLADPAAFAARSAELAGALWEHYVDGPEYSIEAVSSGGVHHILGITAKRTTGAPYFVETGHEVPAVLTEDADRAIRGCVERCLDVLELTAGASHTEVKLEHGRAVVIETHTRAGGDRIPLLTRLVSGVDQYELAVRSVLPRVEPLTRAPRFKHAAVHYFPWQDVTVDGVEGLDACRASDGVVEAELRAVDGESVPVWRYSHERPGHVVAGADDRDELRRRIAAAENLVRPRLS